MIDARELFQLSEPGGKLTALEHTPGLLRPFVTAIAAPITPRATNRGGGTEPTFEGTMTDGVVRQDTIADPVSF